MWQTLRKNATGFGLLLIIAAMLAPGSAALAAEDKDKSSIQPFPNNWFFRSNDRPAVHTNMEGRPAPKLSLADWMNGKLTPNDIEGKIVVLDFWATWCGPCKAAIPHTNKIQKKYKDKGVVVIGVCTSDNGQEKMEQVAKEEGIKYPIARDPGTKSAEAWNVKWYPTYAIIDRTGVVRGVGLKSGSLDKAIKRVLKAQPPQKDNKQAKRQNQGDKRAQAQQASKDNTIAATIPDKWSEAEGQRRTKLAAMEGKAPPTLAVTNWMNVGNDILQNRNLRGKIVVLDFWATWCGPCIKSIPHTNKLQAKYADQDVVFIGVCHPRGGDKMGQKIESENIKYPIALDPRGVTGKKLAVDSYPDYYIIGREGNLAIADIKNNKVEAAVKLMLEKQPAKDTRTADAN